MSAIFRGLLITITGAVALLYYFHFSTRQKIAFVRSNELVYGYTGMNEAHDLQISKAKEYQSNIDTLQMDLQKAMNQYNLEYAKLDKAERAEKEKLLVIQQENFKQYSQNAQKAVEKSNTDLTQGVLNQVNAFVETYAKEHGYTLILGTTTSGNILYGQESMDITEDVLKALNAQYKSLPDSLGTK